VVVVVRGGFIGNTLCPFPCPGASDAPLLIPVVGQVAMGKPSSHAPAARGSLG
jgi:hypothetical protein